MGLVAVVVGEFVIGYLGGNAWCFLSNTGCILRIILVSTSIV